MCACRLIEPTPAYLMVKTEENRDENNSGITKEILPNYSIYRKANVKEHASVEEILLCTIMIHFTKTIRKSM